MLGCSLFMGFIFENCIPAREYLVISLADVVAGLGFLVVVLNPNMPKWPYVPVTVVAAVYGQAVWKCLSIAHRSLCSLPGIVSCHVDPQFVWVTCFAQQETLLIMVRKGVKCP